MTNIRRRVSMIPVALLLSLISVTMARAQEQAQEQAPHVLPGIRVSPPARLKGTGEDSQGPGSRSGIGSNDKGDQAKTIERMNQELKRKVDEVNPTFNTPPLDARSPDTKIGVVNIPAVQQQYGKNFGNSAVPYRPPPLIYTVPLGHR